MISYALNRRHRSSRTLNYFVAGCFLLSIFGCQDSRRQNSGDMRESQIAESFSPPANPEETGDHSRLNEPTSEKPKHGDDIDGIANAEARARGHLVLGEIWEKKGDYGRAIVEYDEGIRLAPDSALLRMHRAKALHEHGYFAEAIDDYNKAIELKPEGMLTRDSTRAFRLYGGRAESRSALGEHQSAIDDYTIAIGLAPSDAVSHWSRAEEYCHLKQYPRAIDDYTKAIELEPNDALIYAMRGDAWLEQREFDKAIADYNTAIKLSPNDAYFWSGRASIHEAQGQYAFAAEDLKSALERASNDADYVSYLAWFLATCPDEDLRDGARAQQLATQACALTDWNDPFHLNTLAAAHATQGDFVEAVRRQRQAISLITFADEMADETEVQNYRERLTLYEQRKPYVAPLQP